MGLLIITNLPDIAGARDPVWYELLCGGYRSAAPTVASFIGCVRDMNEGDSVGLMYLEHYPGMTERELAKICAEASERWDIFDTLVIQRVGEL